MGEESTRKGSKRNRGESGKRETEDIKAERTRCRENVMSNKHRRTMSMTPGAIPNNVPLVYHLQEAK